MSAVMLARIGPVKPLDSKDLITHSEACGRTERTAHARHASHLPEPGQGAEKYRKVSALSEEIVGGMLPEKQLLPRTLRHNVPVSFARPSRPERPHGRRRGVQACQPGERRDARRDRAGEAVLGQGPDHAL